MKLKDNKAVNVTTHHRKRRAQLISFVRRSTTKRTKRKMISENDSIRLKRKEEKDRARRQIQFNEPWTKNNVASELVWCKAVLSFLPSRSRNVMRMIISRLFPLLMLMPTVQWSRKEENRLWFVRNNRWEVDVRHDRSIQDQLYDRKHLRCTVLWLSPYFFSKCPCTFHIIDQEIK